MDEVVERLKNVEKLLAMNLLEEKEYRESVKLLHEAGFDREEIATYLDRKPDNISDVLYRLRQDGEIDD